MTCPEERRARKTFDAKNNQNRNTRVGLGPNPDEHGKGSFVGGPS